MYYKPLFAYYLICIEKKSVYIFFNHLQNYPRKDNNYGQSA